MVRQSLVAVVAVAVVALGAPAARGQSVQLPPWLGGGTRQAAGTWAELNDGGHALTVHFPGAPPRSKGCGADYTATADGHPDEVVVHIHTHHPDHPADVCTALGAMRRVTVRLDWPLGVRTVTKTPGRVEAPVRR